MSQTIATTKMSSRGQVVIPESIRDRLRLGPGVQFAVFAQGDVVMFKVINPPSADEFARLKRELQRQVRQGGLKQSDIPKAISKVRGSR
ncbi:MAG TPA: AbrB/MazE/SpoVT family DNA-binding domain-containing protein [Candidatus Hydrogenedentes bacterium]|nr:AbrB/MazE/SpoVT family DNA-binding domain-containing protein [Candidatus Hydrogenedentota bacterium]HPC17002.1 AbrB/MazE/SpoVT family DNA-binding domain-containing protein [Candidatus Hydrogenedentota bacterium]HRT20859.1 AbrB/MazE/SpoVT family DNA-binding domain-containing protein [Candidatus Hydrogenedentota bacterium]HRT66832.1 AbrB/MazE/SpoVT family DNA-binding domain-containing protein [Candidatus Hydrogenedentota bacterium]